MCFSAGASFGTAAALIPAGVYCVRVALQRDPRYLTLSVTPLVFALQQVCEGVVWLGLRRGDADLARSAALAFMFFAIVFWPCWMPFSVLTLASRRWMRRAIGGAALWGLGVGLSIYLPLALRSREWLRPTVRHHSIEYDFTMLPAFLGIPREVWHGGYLLLVALPLAVQGNRRLTVFSAMVLVSAVLAHVVFAYAFVSIWCAFAALLSAWLCFLFHGLPATPRSPVPVPGA